MPFIEVKTNKNLTSVDIENIEKEVEKHIVLLKKSRIYVAYFDTLTWSFEGENF